MQVNLILLHHSVSSPADLTYWLEDRQMFPGVCVLQLRDDSVVGMMETCARIDSISERQLPWVNGGVYPIRAPPLLHSSSFCRRAPIIPLSLLQVV